MSASDSQAKDPRFTASSVHRMCNYLRISEDKVCLKCPSRTETPYGPGVPGCYSIAEETLQKAVESINE